MYVCDVFNVYFKQLMFRQNRAQRLRDRKRERENSNAGRPLLGKPLDREQEQSFTKSCPNIAMVRNTLTREANLQDAQFKGRGILKANRKSELLQEVNLLGVVQNALVAKLGGPETDLPAQVENLKLVSAAKAILSSVQESTSLEIPDQTSAGRHLVLPGGESGRHLTLPGDESSSGDEHTGGKHVILPTISWIRDLEQSSPRAPRTRKIISC